MLGVSRDPLVSSDIIGDPRASIVDLELTKVIDGDLVKVMSWYDNEWGYANQMLREARSVAGRPMIGLPEHMPDISSRRSKRHQNVPAGGVLGGITMLVSDESEPCDRPDVSKGYLTGAAPAQCS